jgi:hypothetical protein
MLSDTLLRRAAAVQAQLRSPLYAEAAMVLELLAAMSEDVAWADETALTLAARHLALWHMDVLRAIDLAHLPDSGDPRHEPLWCRAMYWRIIAGDGLDEERRLPGVVPVEIVEVWDVWVDRWPTEDDDLALLRAEAEYLRRICSQ